MNQVELQRANRRAAWRWGSLIVGLLGLQVMGGVAAIVLASGDKSVAVVPNYHEKALRWDDEMAAQAASAALGWHCHVDVLGHATASSEAVGLTDASGPTGLRITLTDRQGAPVMVRSGTLRFYHHARASEVRELPIPSGKFSSMELPGCFAAPGLWQVMLELNGESGQRFLHSEELRVSPAGAQRTMDGEK